MQKAATRKIVRSTGVEIATEAFGDSAHPAVVLVMGAMASMLWWPERLCSRLAAEGRYVIRYDNRDTGLSTTWDPGHPGYSSDDMTDDVVRVLDGYGLSAAHVVGMSMGGMIAQRAALEHPRRFLSLTAISTSPVGMDTAQLPPPTQVYQEHAGNSGDVDWSDRQQAIDCIVAEMRVIASPAYPFDETAARKFVEQDHARATRFASAANHFMLQDSQRPQKPVRNLSVPLLVVHGTADPIFPVEHGEAIARAVAGSRLLRLEHGGHEINEAHWPELIAAIALHTSSAKA